MGYYSRANNLHKGAKFIIENHQGKMPSTKKELLKVPGIGPYTAGAILSIAFFKNEPVVDGNVIRVVSRLSASAIDPKKQKVIIQIQTFYEKRITIKKTKKQDVKEVWKYCEDLMTDIEDVLKNPGDFNQAVMELGALICTPANPKCEQCPLNEICEAKQLNKANEFPVKTVKKKTNPTFHVISFVLRRKSDHSVLITKRMEKGLLQNQYELLNHVGRESVDVGERGKILSDRLKTLGVCAKCIRDRLEEKKNVNKKNQNGFVHKFSHLTHVVEFYEYAVDDDSKCNHSKACLFSTFHASDKPFETSGKEEVKWMVNVKHSGLTRQHTKTLEMLASTNNTLV